MFLTSQDVFQFEEEKLKSFLGKKIHEGLYLDYKEDLSSGPNKDPYREVLKDVTAFANAHGGDIIIGAKEPAENVLLEDQLIGIEDGKAIAGNLERLVSASIEPRIPGLKIIPILLSNGRYAIVAHIPPSLGRPHMVNHKGHRSFYIRHWESSNPMSTHELRESVLTSISAEATAQNYMINHESEVRHYLVGKEPVIFIQAMPLLSMEQPWDTLDNSMVDILRSTQRERKYQTGFNLVTGDMPKISIVGILSKDNREDPNWFLEIHRNGYVSVLFKDIDKEPTTKKYALHYGFCDLFNAFCVLLFDLWEKKETDLPYIIRCKYLNANGTVLWTNSQRYSRTTEPYEKDEIIWPDHIRLVGDPLTDIAESLCKEMYNAFGLKEPIK
jgi:hypothetical protein